MPTDPDPLATTTADAAERLERLWQQGQRPDMDAFLAGQGPLAPADTAAALRVDQRERWQAGERVPAEDYLRRHPGVAADPEAAVDVIFNEFLLRDRLGERPEPDEYLRRFPGHAGVLRRQLELHRALAADSVTRSAPAPDATEPAARPTASPPTAFVFAGAQQSRRELQTVLRKRLRFLALVTVIFFLLYFPVALPLLSSLTRLVAYFFTLAVNGILGGLLWSRRPLSLRALRGAEGIFVATAMVVYCWQNYEFHHGGWLATLAGHDLPGMLLAFRYLSWPWAVAIIAYGVVIPNTGRRCAVVVGLMALCAVAFNLFQGLHGPAIEPGLLGRFVAGFCLDVGVASAVAVFGAHRLEALRQAASAARRLGPYRLKDRLGAGGMGEVYLAEHGLLRRPCALKLIRPERAGDLASLRRFEREVQAMATLSHPNTVEIFDYGHADDGTFYYVMEYLPGLTLEQLVARDGPLSPARAVHMLRQVCGSLAEAHTLGLVHRDVKPSNIITCRRGGRDDVAKLLDFGLATGQSLGAGSTKLTQEGMQPGTPAYMSPEQAAGRPEVDARSDLYSLGAVAYFLLTGQPPFVRPSMVETLAAHLGVAPVPPRALRPGLAAELEAVVLRCLEKEPARRFADAEALERALARCAD
jgi:serine/threonine-protein kinase